MQTTVARLDRADLGEKAAVTMDELQGTATKMNHVLEQVDGDDGLVASTKRATEALGGIGRDGRRTQREVEGALRDLSDAADSLRALTSALERDPEMLLKGKTKGRRFE